MPKAEQVEICHEPLVRDCDAPGEVTCTMEYETVCDTVYHENEVRFMKILYRFSQNSIALLG